MSTVVVTDSSCDLTSRTLADLGVKAVPLKVRIGEEELRDGRELTALECVRRMEEEGARPRTRPPDPDDFAAVYRAALARGHDVVSVHLSSRLSETLTHAQEGAKRAGASDAVHVVDGLAVSSPLAEQVRAAARAAAAGRDAAEVEATARRVRDATLTLIAPGPAHRPNGGGASAALGDLAVALVARRPLMILREGVLIRAATMPKSRPLDAIARELERRLGDASLRMVIGIAAQDPGVALPLQERLGRGRLRIEGGRVQRIGAVLAAHVGPGGLIVAAYPEHALIAPRNDAS